MCTVSISLMAYLLVLFFLQKVCVKISADEKSPRFFTGFFNIYLGKKSFSGVLSSIEPNATDKRRTTHPKQMAAVEQVTTPTPDPTAAAADVNLELTPPVTVDAERAADGAEAAGASGAGGAGEDNKLGGVCCMGEKSACCEKVFGYT